MTMTSLGLLRGRGWSQWRPKLDVVVHSLDL